MRQVPSVAVVPCAKIFTLTVPVKLLRDARFQSPLCCPPGLPKVTAPTATLFDGDMNGVLAMPMVLTTLVEGPPVPVGAITYTWEAIAHGGAGGPVTRAVGSGNNLSWQPASTTGLLDRSLNQQLVDICVRVVDTAGNHGPASGVCHRFTLRFAPG